MSATPSPCRLYVYLAREAPLAVLLRRGPSEWTRLSLWHTDSDEFEHGQWFHARVYERRCDVSPDGSLFAYFALKAGADSGDVDADSWIAVSRPPYFTALALWSVGTTYCAGAHFVDNRSLFASWIEHPPDVGALPSWLRLTKDLRYAPSSPEWTDYTVFFNRLLTDGWIQAGETSAGAMTWERQEPRGSRHLVMRTLPEASFSDYGGRSVQHYALRSASRATTDIGRATWAGWDHRGRLLVARDGQILEWRGPNDERAIADLNDQRPDPQPAPGWAREWPAAPVAG